MADAVVTTKTPNCQQLSRMLHTRRSGVVIGLQPQTNKLGQRTLYVHVQWDHLRSPSLHARHRLEKISDEEGKT